MTQSRTVSEAAVIARLERKIGHRVRRTRDGLYETASCDARGTLSDLAQLYGVLRPHERIVP